jgi:hypothetical protein
MTDVTQILSEIEHGDPAAAERLLPLVYNELRKLAAAKLSNEKPGQTLQATALVHEAYVRLVDIDESQQWNGRGHFFAAAAEAMRQSSNRPGTKGGQAWRTGGSCPILVRYQTALAGFAARMKLSKLASEARQADLVKLPSLLDDDARAAAAGPSHGRAVLVVRRTWLYARRSTAQVP